MNSNPYQWTLANWQAHFFANGYSESESGDLALEALQWHEEAQETGGEGPNDTDPHYFWIGFSC